MRFDGRLGKRYMMMMDYSGCDVIPVDEKNPPEV